MSAKKTNRRKRKSLSSSNADMWSSDEDQEMTPDNTHKRKTEPRSSERLQQKRLRTFQMPTRDDVWNQILPCKSPEKYSHLKPRKLVNNFTRESNRYNYEPLLTSGSESMDDFIVGDAEFAVSSDENSTADVNPVAEQSEDTGTENNQDSKASARINEHDKKTRRRSARIMSESESSSESDHVVKTPNRNRSLLLQSDSETDSYEIEASARTNAHGESCVSFKRKNDERSQSLDGEKLSADEAGNVTASLDVKITSGETLKGNVKESDESEQTIKIKLDVEDSTGTEGDSDEEIHRPQRRNTSIIVSDDDDCDDDVCHNPDLHVTQGNDCEDSCASNVNVHMPNQSSDLVATRHKDSYVEKDMPGQSHHVYMVDNETDSEHTGSGTNSCSDTRSEADSELQSSDEEDVNRSERTRVGLLKKKRAKEALFEQFRNARRKMLARENL